MSKNTLRLKSGVTLIEQGTQVGLCLNEKTRWTQDEAQTQILRTLSQHPLDLDALCGDNSQPPGNPQTALAIAALILDFGDYLEP